MCLPASGFYLQRAIHILRALSLKNARRLKIVKMLPGTDLADRHGALNDGVSLTAGNRVLCRESLCLVEQLLTDGLLRRLVQLGSHGCLHRGLHKDGFSLAHGLHHGLLYVLLEFMACFIDSQCLHELAHLLRA